MIRPLSACLLVLLLSACASAGYGRKDLRPVADPSAVIATESAFARAAREDGQWTAFRDFAADDAVMLGRNGFVPAVPWLRQQADPAETVQWSPHRVFSSCDGLLAVSSGGFAYPTGEVGTFATVWQRDKKREYTWALDFGVEQEAAPQAPEMIAARVADCTTPPAHQVAGYEGLVSRREGFSADRTLHWVADYRADGSRALFTYLWQDGEMKQVMDLEAAGEPSE